MMLGLLLAAAALGQVDVGSYFGQGQTTYVQAEPYYEVEDGNYVEPQDAGSYPVYDFTDGGDGDAAPGRATRYGNGGVVSIDIGQPGPGDFVIDLLLSPNPFTTGGLVTVSGTVTVLFYSETNEVVLEHPTPIFAVFIFPRASWTWTSGVFRDIPPGTFMTATFRGGGLGSGGGFGSRWTCPGVTDGRTIR